MIKELYRRMAQVVLVGCVVVCGVSVQAQSYKDDQPDMPDITMLEDAAFMEQTVEYSDKPFSDSALSYVVRLPKDWQKSENEGSGADMSVLSAKIFTEAGRYYGPVSVYSGFPSRFTIKTVNLDYELTAEQWFIQHLVSNGFALQGLKIYNEDRAEALYVVLDGDTSYVVRAAALKNGKRIVLAEYMMPIDLWEDDKAMQTTVVQNFKLVSPDDSLVEKMKPYHFLDIAQVQYPLSWTLRAPPMRSVDYMTIQLLRIPPQSEEQRYHGQTVLDGKIELFLTSVFAADSLEAEGKRIEANLEKTGLSLSDKVLVDLSPEIQKHLRYKETRRYKAIDKDNDLLTYEYWISLMSYGDYYYYITLLTPSKEEDFYIWSRNTETYKLVLRFLQPQYDSLVSE